MKRHAFLLFTLLCATALAQDDRRAALFTQARQLPLVSQTVQVNARAGKAQVRLVQVFFNDGAELGQADYQLHLPAGAEVISFGFWQGERFIQAELKEKAEAERAHERAAKEGRATGLLKSEEGVQRFTVFPVKAHEHQRIELTLRVPVAREMGRNQLALAMDRFLGRGPATAAVVADIHSEEPLADVGVNGARVRVLSRTARAAQVAFSAGAPVELWWTERGPPLSVGAEAVALAEEGHAVALRALLNDAGAWRAPYRSLQLFVDGSFSMRRRRGAVAAAVERLLAQSPAEARVWAVGESTREVRGTRDPDELVKRALDGTAGHGATAAHFTAAMKAAGCGRPQNRCVAVSDLQLADLEGLGAALEAFILLADAHERAHFEPLLPPGLSIFQPDVEAPAKLRALADEKVLPVLQLLSVSQEGRVLDAVRPPSMRVAEGGLLRLYFDAAGRAPLEVTVRVAGVEQRLTVALSHRDPESEEGRAVRLGYWERKLAEWMASYRRTPNPDLKQMIVAASLREGVPTAFTALQGASPELSLHDIKPGDPLLTVRAEPGLMEVVAWYPFGETRRLVPDPLTLDHHDRFLVPRGWEDRSYAVEVSLRYADGTVRHDRVFYALDDAGPKVAVSRTGTLLELSQVDGAGDLSAVRLEGPQGFVRVLSPVGGRWLTPAEGLPERFTLAARDRAGNTTYLDVDGHGRSKGPAVPKRATPRPEAQLAKLTWAHPSGLRIQGDQVELEVEGRRFGFRHADAPLSSAALTAHLVTADGLLFGTARGDLVRLTCDGNACRARSLGRGFFEHPISGLAPLGGDKVLVGVLGKGLHELRGERVVPSALKVGSAFITGVQAEGKEVLVATGYNGLWRIVSGRALKSRFGHAHVTGLRRSDGGVEITSGALRYRQMGRDRFVPLPASLPKATSPAVMASVLHQGALILGGFDSGLHLWQDGRAVPLAVELGVLERHINALAVFGGDLWVGSEGGLLRLRQEGGAWSVQRVLTAGVQDLAASDHRLAVATSGGLVLVDAKGAAASVDPQAGTFAPRLFAVAWQGEALYLGGLEGLFLWREGKLERLGARDGFRGGWVTALAVHGGEMHVGTYADGVWRVQGQKVEQLAALGSQWVPLRGLSSLGGTLWVGGLGEPASRIAPSGAVTRVALPTRDTNGFAKVQGGVLALTGDGPMVLEEGEPSLSAR